jgi:AraC-like DNA-binding protein
MPVSGSCIFTGTDDYQANLHEMPNLLARRPRDFRARLTWVELPKVRLLRAQEASPRVAYVSLPPELVYIVFPAQRGTPLICDGVELHFGDMMFHSRGERLHQRTTGTSRWGSISLTPATLMAFGRALAGRDLVPPPVGQILHPPFADRMRLLRLHTLAIRIAETKLNHIWHPEVARALEQDLFCALVTCLTAIEPQDTSPAVPHLAGILTRFEDVLAAHPSRLLPMPEICSAIGVSDRALRVCCTKSLGMSPCRYQHLRRLRLVRTELLRGNSTTETAAEVTERYGFTDLHCFITEYMRAYGETPLSFP